MQIGQYTAIGGLKSRQAENFVSIPCHDVNILREIERKYNVITDKLQNNNGTRETWFDIENHFHNCTTPRTFGKYPV